MEDIFKSHLPWSFLFLLNDPCWLWIWPNLFMLCWILFYIVYFPNMLNSSLVKTSGRDIAQPLQWLFPSSSCYCFQWQSRLVTLSQGWEECNQDYACCPVKLDIFVLWGGNTNINKMSTVISSFCSLSAVETKYWKKYFHWNIWFTVWIVLTLTSKWHRFCLLMLLRMGSAQKATLRRKSSQP